MSYIVFYDGELSTDTFDRVTLGYPQDAMQLLSDFSAHRLTDIIAWTIGEDRDLRLAAYRVQTQDHVEHLKFAEQPAFVMEEDKAVFDKLVEWSMCLNRLTELINSADMLSDFLPLHRNWMNFDMQTSSQIQKSDSANGILKKLIADEQNLRKEVQNHVRTVQHWPAIA